MGIKPIDANSKRTLGVSGGRADSDRTYDLCLRNFPRDFRSHQGFELMVSSVISFALEVNRALIKPREFVLQVSFAGQANPLFHGRDIVLRQWGGGGGKENTVSFQKNFQSNGFQGPFFLLSCRPFLFSTSNSVPALPYP